MVKAIEKAKELSPAPKVEIIEQAPVRLDLGCGASPRPGFTGVDMSAPNASVKCDLLKFPWPWRDDSVDEIVCSHYLEHVPHGYLCPDGQVRICAEVGAVDLLTRTMAEAWRILKPGGRFEIVVPHLRSNRAFQDPTHQRFFCETSFHYFNQTWVESNGLGHYAGLKCNFLFDEQTPRLIYDAAEQLRAPEAVMQRGHERWNVVTDLIVVLRKPVPAAPTPAP